MRTRDDILSELVELKQNPPQSFSVSMYKTNKKNAMKKIKIQKTKTINK